MKVSFLRVPRLRTGNARFWQFLNAALLSALIAIIAFVLFSPVDVLKNETWKLTVQGDTHYPGDVLVVKSEYEKVRDVTGVAKRYIECKNPIGGYVRYPINEADANRQPTGENKPRTGTGVFLPVPVNIPVPTDCFVTISITYDIYKLGNWTLRSHTETNSSGIFKLLPKPEGTDESCVSNCQQSNSLNVELKNVPIDSTQPMNYETKPVENVPQSSNQQQQQTPQQDPITVQGEVEAECKVDILFIHIGCKE